MPDETDSGVETVTLVPEFEKLGIRIPKTEASLGISELDGSIEVGIVHDGEPVESELITPDPDTPNEKRFSLELGLVKIEASLDTDQSAGEVTATGELSVRDLIHHEWKKVVDIDKVIPYSPAHGSVGNDPLPNPPSFDDARFGKSRMSSRNVTRIFVEDRPRLIADVGQVVKKALWQDRPDWVFNTVACVGPHDANGRGSYSDPTSPWFNVFLGYYQIDAPKPDWTRPFGYEAANGVESNVCFEEIVRLGKSDWNYFSNWMYGVPVDETARFDSIDLSKLELSQKPAGKIGHSSWHRVFIGKVEFVTAYQSEHEGAGRLVDNSLVSKVWRKAFGQPNPKPDFEESFIGASLDADMYIAYWEDDAAFHTVIFGGTARTDKDPGFLDGQMRAAEAVIESAYPKLGF